MQYLPMGIYTIIYNTSPFWASIFAFIMLRESISKVEITSMVFSFALIILLFYYRSQQTNIAPPVQQKTNNMWVGLVLAVGSAICASISAVATRKMQ